MCTALTGGALGYGISQARKAPGEEEEEKAVTNKENLKTEQKQTSRAPTA